MGGAYGTCKWGELMRGGAYGTCKWEELMEHVSERGLWNM